MSLGSAGRIDRSGAEETAQLPGNGDDPAMDKPREIFADGIGEIVLSGGMVRLDLVALSGSQREASDKPKLEFRQRIVMPPDGFLRSFSAMEDLVRQLVDAGLVKPRDGAGQNAVRTTEGSDKPRSPNF
jgi:hypothetical protein